MENKHRSRRVLLFGLVGVGSCRQPCTQDTVSAPFVAFSPSCINYSIIMSRGGRGGRGGGRGGFGGGGRGGFGAGNLPPMGLTFADIQSMSREQSALYPVRVSCLQR